MASEVRYVVLMTATLLVFISSPASNCVAAYQGNPDSSSIGRQTDRPGNDPTVTTSQTALRVSVQSINQWPGSKENNNIRNEPYAFSLYEAVTAVPDFLPQLSLAPQGSYPAGDKHAIADAGSLQRPPTPAGSRDDSRNRLFIHGDSFAEEIYDSRFSRPPDSHEVTSPMLSGASTNLNPGNSLDESGPPRVRIDAQKEFLLKPWMYSIALIAFVLYSRRRGSL